MVQALRDLIEDEYYDEASLLEAFSSFQCAYSGEDSDDVSLFLKNDAIKNEKYGITRTYLIINDDAWNNGAVQIDGYFSIALKVLYFNTADFTQGILNIEGYFSVTHKAVIFDDNISGSIRNKLTGTKRAESQFFVLIGQLGKYIDKKDNGAIVSSKSTSQDLLNDAINIICKSSDYIICRNIIIECKDIEKVQKIYRDYGFSELQFDGDLHTMYLKLAHDIKF